MRLYKQDTKCKRLSSKKEHHLVINVTFTFTWIQLLHCFGIRLPLSKTLQVKGFASYQ